MLLPSVDATKDLAKSLRNAPSNQQGSVSCQFMTPRVPPYIMSKGEYIVRMPTL